MLLKWCYTGPSTCNCVAAAQSWPLKGQTIIYLKWQQLHFYLPAEKKKKNLPALHCIFWQQWWAELMPFPCICMLCCESVEAASCLGDIGSATSWPLSASCHHDIKLQRNGLCAQGLLTNPVKCSTAIDMAYLNKHGLYKLCSFSAIFEGLLELLLEHLLHCINTNAHKTFIYPFIALLVVGHIYCAWAETG